MSVDPENGSINKYAYMNTVEGVGVTVGVIVTLGVILFVGVIVGYKKNKKIRGWYNHYDSYPTGIGVS